MTFNGFGTQTTWPDGTGFSAGIGETFGGRTTIGELCHGMNNCVSAYKNSLRLQLLLFLSYVFLQ